MSQAKAIVNRMMQQDLFSQWLGITVMEVKPGFCRLKMTVRNEMCNGFGIAHGGIAYSLADSALAFASNAHGRKAVSIETSISHLRPVHTGSVLEAIATEVTATNRLGVYDVKITLADGTLAALFKGTVFLKEEQWTKDL